MTSIELALPASRVAAHAVELELEERFFDRTFRLRGEVEGRRGGSIVLASWRGVRREDPGLQRQPLSTGRDTRLLSLSLEIEDGDDAPLTLRRAWIETDSKRVIVAAPAGTHRVLMGDPAAEAPRYDLASARDLLAALPAGEITLAPLGANPEHVAPGLFDRLDAGTVALWSVVALAIVVLVALSLRLAVSPDAPPDDASVR